MKRIIWMAVLVLAFAQTAYGLILGSPLAVVCPKCGAEKGLLSMVSGNTFGAVQWSDMYLDASMMPRLSPVQKCPGCGGYFLLNKSKASDAVYDYDADIPVAESGRLTYAEMKEALVTLLKDSLTKEDERNIRIEFLHRNNYAFRVYEEEMYGNDPKLDIFKWNDEDRKLHHENIIALTALLDENSETERMLMDELYREAGEYKKCLSILNDLKKYDEYLWTYAEQIRRKNQEKDSGIFMIDDE